jgi:hypothetical protein
VKGSRDALSLRGIPLDPTSFGSPTNGYAPKYVTANTRLELAALDTLTDATLAAAGVLSWTGRTRITAPGDGSLLVEKADGTDLLTLATSGALSWPTGLGAIFQLSGPTDQTFSIRAGASTQLALCSDHSISMFAINGTAQKVQAGALLLSSTYTGGQSPPDNGIGSLGVIGFLASATTGVDVGFSRTGLGSVALGSGVAGNASGSLALSTLVQGAAVTRKSSSKTGIADNTATTFATVAIAANEKIAGRVTWVIVQTGGTTDEVRTGSFQFAARRLGDGTLTMTDLDPGAETGDALTVTMAITDGANVINLRVTSDSALAGAPAHAIYYTVEVSPTATVTPQ